jgi:biopolymer transport protein TolR
MPRRRGRGREPLVASAEINVTSLVDVALTLLVIFIITAPLMQGGVEVRLPKARTESVPATDGLVVSVDRDGQIFLGTAPVAWEEFERRFPEAVAAAGTQSVYLRADDEVAYGRVVRVLGAIKESDVATVGLIAEPEPRRGRP